MNSLLTSLSVLVNMLIAYVAFSVAYGGFSWPVHHGDIYHLVLYHACHIMLGILGISWPK
jgi:hypothetical protein